jgi:hypothetical protein
VADVEGPPGVVRQSGALRLVHEAASAAGQRDVAEEGDPAAVGGVVEVVGQHLGGLELEQVERLEVIGQHQIQMTIVVGIEGDRADRVAEERQPGALGDVLEAPLAFCVRAEVAEQDRRTEAPQVQIEEPVVVVVEPQRVRHDRAGVVAAADAGARSHVREDRGAVLHAVAAHQVVLLALVGVDEEEIVVAVVVVVAHGDRRTAIGEHLQDLRLVTLAEAPRRLHEAHAGARGDLVEADRGLGDSRGGRG